MQAMNPIQPVKLKPTKLSRVLSYENPEIVARFCKDLCVSKKTAEVVFKDMIRYLWLSYRADELRARYPKREIPDVSIMEPMLIIDEMWHTFVLYTKEYEEFSYEYFGHFVHHAPTPTLPTAPGEAVPLKTNADFEREMETFVEFVWEELGEEVAVRWFQEFPRKFSPTEIRRRQLKAVGKE